MFTIETLLLLSICGGAGTVIGWLFSQFKGLSYQAEARVKPERVPAPNQSGLSLVVTPTKPHRSPAARFTNRADCIEALVSGPMEDENYMITTECIIFTGTKEECADFLEDRGIIPFEDTIEPFDIRLQSKMNELGIRVFRRNL